ncbi:MAG: hypothetical protein Q8K72_10315, partial [Acidimicrobiales bacterium]|nr:hypothetical protein [Acidimicrobiales bacterium]
MRKLGRELRRSPMLLAGLILVAVFVVVGLLAPWIAPYDPGAVTGDPYESPSWAHLLGTNDGGADLLSRLVWGSRTTLVVAMPSLPADRLRDIRDLVRA